MNKSGMFWGEKYVETNKGIRPIPNISKIEQIINRKDNIKKEIFSLWFKILKKDLIILCYI